VVVAKGDLTNRGQIHEWREYADLVHAASVPIIGVPGNHDRAFRNGLAPEDAARAFGLTLASPLHVVDGAGYRLVLVDSTTGGHNHGRLDAVADDAVTAVAETEPGSVALVFLHHQLHRWPVREVWPVGVGRLESRRFMEAVARTGTRCMVSSGHTHRHRRWEHREVTATQVGSTKDYPGVWAGYVITDRAVRQVVHRVTEPDCLRWTEFTRRADDNETTVRDRLGAYHAQTAPLIAHYDALGLLARVDAMQEIDAVARDLERVVTETTAGA